MLRIAGTGAVLFALAGGAFAADEQLMLGIGVHYSEGSYGTATTTTIKSVAATARYDTHRWSFKATLPYLFVSGSSSVIPGVGRARAAAGTATSTQHGLGDLTTSATYNAYYAAQSQLGLDVTGKVKWPTADRDKNLGTGATDVGFQVDAYKGFDRLTLFAGVGYTVFGDAPGVSLNDAFNATLGASYKLDERDSAGLAYDERERLTPTAGPLRELTAFWSRKLDNTWRAQLYVLKGLADGSPDWGAGASVLRAF
jgi:outer membrane putative beta-barrel porin/alpha-amylase